MVDENGITEEESEESTEKTEEQQARELDFILDIPLELSVELGKTKMLVNDLLQLGQGSIIELNKLAGEPLEVYINRKLIARGEVVVVNEKFGVRLTDVITPIDRVKSLAAEEQ
ncbi:MAG: flagellar motor switch protein FliN [Desulfobacter sp.]|nr:MAG: flagellar motor switch protein FliN [Desulfobacter sp.]